MLEIVDLDYINFTAMKTELSGGRQGGRVDTFAFTSTQDSFALSLAEASSFGSNSLTLTITDANINKKELKYGIVSKSSASANAFASTSNDCEIFSSSFKSDSRFSSRTYNISV